MNNKQPIVYIALSVDLIHQGHLNIIGELDPHLMLYKQLVVYYSFTSYSLNVLIILLRKNNLLCDLHLSIQNH
jgi:hypothetical protein